MSQSALFQDPKAGSVIDELWALEGWPKDLPKDQKFVSELMAQFPMIDLVEQARAWRAWMYDNESKLKGVNYRARFRTWCSRAASGWGTTSRGRRSKASNRKGVGAIPQGPAAFGPSSNRLEE